MRRVWFLLVLGCGGEPAPPVNPPIVANLPELVYRGFFRLGGLDEGEDHRLGYSHGVIALAEANQLWVASHEFADVFAPFAIPVAPLDTAEAAVALQVGSWQDLSQGVQEQIAENRELNGLLRVGAGWLYTVHAYYNGDSSHDPVLGYEGLGLWPTSDHSQATAGYLAEVPSAFREQLGADYLAGLAGTTNHQLASHGPVAHGFRFDPDAVPAADATIATTPLWFFPLSEPDDDFTDVAAIRGAAFTEDRLYLFGSTGLGQHWYGEEVEGELIDPCGGGKGYHAEARAPWVWVIDPASLAAVALGTASPRITPMASGSLHDLLGRSDPCAQILGASYDPFAGIIYLALPDLLAEEEPQPAIYVLEAQP